MKKSILALLFFVCITALFSAPAFASAIGLAMPEPDERDPAFGASIEGNFVFNRNLERVGDITNGKVKESNQTYVRLSIQPMPNVKFYGNIGTANLIEEYNFERGTTNEIEFDYGLLLGGGSNILYQTYEGFGVGWDNQFNWWNTDIKSLSGEGNPTLLQRGSMDNFDVQSTIYLKYDWEYLNDNVLTGYLGGCYSYFRSQENGTIEAMTPGNGFRYGDITNSDKMGAIIGLSYHFNYGTEFNVEGRFFSETALTIGGSYMF